jgi:hypothetical protein
MTTRLRTTRIQSVTAQTKLRHCIYSLIIAMVSLIPSVNRVLTLVSTGLAYFQGHCGQGRPTSCSWGLRANIVTLQNGFEDALSYPQIDEHKE